MDSKKENLTILKRGCLVVIIVAIISIISYLFFPISIVSRDFDTLGYYNYTTIESSRVSYIFTLSGVRVKIDDKVVVPKMAYSGRKNSMNTVLSENNEYFVVYPLSWKDLSLYELQNKIVEVKSSRKDTVVKSISISDIRTNYQKIDISKVIFYKTDGNINRLIYENLDTFKIVTYSNRSEVTENELYWNINDGYYYLISPNVAEDVFVVNPEFSSVGDIV